MWASKAQTKSADALWASKAQTKSADVLWISEVQNTKGEPNVIKKAVKLKKTVFTILSSVLIACFFISPSIAEENYTIKQYIKDRGLKNARVVAPGRLKIDGTRLICGKRPTIFDPTLDDFGGAFDGFIILNPRLIKRLPRQVKIWIYSHECAHQFRGPDEATADCFAIKRGVRRGWLKADGMKQICKFIWSAPASHMHPPGPERCAYMKRCFASVQKKK